MPMISALDLFLTPHDFIKDEIINGEIIEKHY